MTEQTPQAPKQGTNAKPPKPRRPELKIPSGDVMPYLQEAIVATVADMTQTRANKMHYNIANEIKGPILEIIADRIRIIHQQQFEPNDSND